MPTLDPVNHKAGFIKHPVRDPKTPSSTDLPRGPSAYWGDEAIWDGHTSIHNPMMDEQGPRLVHGAHPSAGEPGLLQGGIEIIRPRRSRR